MKTDTPSASLMTMPMLAMETSGPVQVKLSLPNGNSHSSMTVPEELEVHLTTSLPEALYTVT